MTLWFFMLFHIKFAFLPFYCERYPLILQNKYHHPSDASMTRFGAMRLDPLELRLVAALCTCLGGTDLVAFTLGRALADPEVIEISERPNRLSYGFQ